MAKSKKRGRPLNGILVLDKPVGVTSNAALQDAKWLYFAAKAGHTGSLDPLASGVLPLCFGEATKFSQFLLEADKAYESTFVLGARSTTDDADGDVESVADATGLDQQQVEQALAGFMGEQMQMPPMYSAIKHNGKRLYALAREGEEVEREPRAVRIDRLEMLAMRDSAQPGCIEIDVDMRVSKGTYVRRIAADLGEALGVGGYVSALRRSMAGPFGVAQSVGLDTLKAMKEAGEFEQMDALLLPVEAALANLPVIELDESMGFYLRRGQPIQVAGSPLSGNVKLRSSAGDFIGVGEIIDDGRVAPRRLLAS